MMYWYDAAIKLERAYSIQKKKIDYYSQITGVQATNVEILQTAYENKLVIDRQIRTNHENQMLGLKKQNRGLKIKNTVLTIGVGALTATTIYFAIF